MDASNMLKPMLAREELRSRRDHAGRVSQAHREGPGGAELRWPSWSSSRGHASPDLLELKERYEVHHNVRITDGAVIAAATLSHRYISDRFLPDKAIDLIDEAANHAPGDRPDPRSWTRSSAAMQLEIEARR